MSRRVSRIQRHTATTVIATPMPVNTKESTTPVTASVNPSAVTAGR